MNDLVSEYQQYQDATLRRRVSSTRRRVSTTWSPCKSLRDRVETPFLDLFFYHFCFTLGKLMLMLLHYLPQLHSNSFGVKDLPPGVCLYRLSLDEKRSLKSALLVQLRHCRASETKGGLIDVPHQSLN